MTVFELYYIDLNFLNGIEKDGNEQCTQLFFPDNGCFG